MAHLCLPPDLEKAHLSEVRKAHYTFPLSATWLIKSDRHSSTMEVLLFKLECYFPSISNPSAISFLLENNQDHYLEKNWSTRLNEEASLGVPDSNQEGVPMKQNTTGEKKE